MPHTSKIKTENRKSSQVPETDPQACSNGSFSSRFWNCPENNTGSVHFVCVFECRLEFVAGIPWLIYFFEKYAKPLSAHVAVSEAVFWGCDSFSKLFFSEPLHRSALRTGIPTETWIFWEGSKPEWDHSFHSQDPMALKMGHTSKTDTITQKSL